MSNIKKLMMTAAGGAGPNVEEVFSTYLYTGNATDRTITNGIDLSTEGGLVWIKRRDTTGNHFWFDTERTLEYSIQSNETDGQSFRNETVEAYNTDGFDLGFGSNCNASSGEFASWTWRKAPKFFDIVTYTGNGVAGRQISHSLGCDVGMLVIKGMSVANPWSVWHNDFTGTAKYMTLNSADPAYTNGESRFGNGSTYINPTSSNFTVGTALNDSGQTYVAYLFAHNDGDGDFGLTGDQDIIKCGSYTGDGSNTDGPKIDLGFEPQWLLVKCTTQSYDWMIFDSMRGFRAYDLFSQTLRPNTTAADSLSHRINPHPDGFKVNDNNGLVNQSGESYIYIAIRRGPMAVPESATDVFSMDMDGATNNHYTANHVVDFAFYKSKDNSYDWNVNSRLTQGESLKFNKTDAESGNTLAQFDIQNGWADSSALTSEYPTWMWQRAPKFFDVVTYKASSVSTLLDHNLGVPVEMAWIKARDTTSAWNVLLYDDLLEGQLNTSNALTSLNSFYTSTATTFKSTLHATNRNYIAYLFASLDGISKVGSYTGNSSNTQNIDCGFSSGARFVMIKRTDAAGNWNIYDTERGIVAGDDSRLELNTTDAEYTISDWVDPLSSGFTVVTFGGGDDDPNINGASYIFYAIA